MSIVDQGEIEVLLNLLRDSDTRTLLETCQAFQRTVQTQQYFRFCYALVFLLKDKNLLKESQRVSALVLIHFGCKGGIQDGGAANPFVNQLIHIAGDEDRGSVERVLANDIIQSKLDDQVMQLSPESILQSVSSSSTSSLPGLKDLQTTYAEQLKPSNNNNLGCFRQASLDPLILDTDFKYIPFPDSDIASAPASAKHPTQPNPQQQLLLNRTLHGFEPNFLRPPPPKTEIQPYHFLWLSPQPPSTPLFNNSSIHNDRIESEYEQMIKNASEGPLNANQLKRAQFLLRADPSLSVRHRLPVDEFQKCLESNRDFVESVLKTTIRVNSESGLIMEYLNSLLTVNASLNSLEVVGRLALEDGLPQEFLQTYFSHVINECLQLKDEGLQNRRVKLVCVMFLNLLKKQVMLMESNQELSAELMNFCIQFSNISEATALFRLLRQSMNENENQPS